MSCSAFGFLTQSQTLHYKNGYRVPDPYPTVGIGGYPLKENQLTEDELDEIINYHPIFTYTRTSPVPVQEFIPSHVALDKKLLRFYGHFKEDVPNSPNERDRIRKVTICYYLEDDSMHIYEPVQLNSGLLQGWILKRQKIPKNDVGDFYTWKDLNVNIDIPIYGRIYHLSSCDEFTKNFFESEGMVLNKSEPLEDVNESKCIELTKNASKCMEGRSRRKFYEADRQVLRFYAVWDDRKEMFGDLRKFAILYYLTDDTIEVIEFHSPNDGRDPCPTLIRRHKIPKDRDDIPETFPAVCMELSDKEVKDFYGPNDLMVGNTIVIYGRAFLLYDCDDFTRAWYKMNVGINDFEPIDIGPKKPLESTEKISCKSTRSKPFNPSEDYDKSLRYGAKLVGVPQSDNSRKFIITYRLADDTIQIWETPVKNSGFPGGTFLKRTRVLKPENDKEKSEYYGPSDFYIGAIIDIFGTHFIITEVDKYVIKYAESHRDIFSDDLIENLTSVVGLAADSKGNNDNRVCKRSYAANIQRSPGDVDQIVDEMSVQFRKLGITDERSLGALFLKFNKDRVGHVDINGLKALCRKFQLPEDLDILNRFLDRYGTDGQMTHHEFLAFILNKEKPKSNIADSCVNSKCCV
nr:EF hand domain containing protein 1 [Hymenolepis microstoma]